MIDPEAARDLVAKHLGQSWRAEHSIFVGDLLAMLALDFDADEDLWRVVGYCHDLDFFVTENDRPRHGVLAAAWLEDGLLA